MFGELHFLRPYWFLALIPLAVAIWYLARQHLRNRHWETICDPGLLPYILVGRQISRHYTSIVLLALASLLAVIALAGPSWERLPQAVFKKQSALLIALDLSYSMYADDVGSSRLERARFKISDLLDLRKEGQTALLVYAGDAFTVTPLTDDIKTIKAQLSALSPAIMPVPGSNAGIAVNKAVDLLQQAGVSQGHILFITDDIDPVYKDEFIAARDAGYRISVLAVGTDEGSPVKLRNGHFLEDRAGNIVIPRLDQDNLKQLADAGSGRYAYSQIDDRDIEYLNSLFTTDSGTDKKAETEFDSDQWQELGPWLVLFIIPIMALAFRRGYLSILLCIMIVNSNDAHAFEWRDLWLNKNQQAMRALEDKQPDKAMELFSDEDWQATARYRAGDFVGAEDLLKSQTDERSLYNRGNALAKQGRYEEAIAAYDAVLKNNPRHEDAKFNKDLIEKELEKQQRQQPSESNQNRDQEQQAPQQTSQDPQQQNTMDQNTGQQDAQQQDATADHAPLAADTKQQQPLESQQAQRQQDMEEQGDEQAMNDQQQEKSSADQKQTETDQQAMSELDEQQQASEQWLRRIPDDPAGLLRRKFKYQYQQQGRKPTSDQYW